MYKSRRKTCQNNRSVIQTSFIININVIRYIMIAALCNVPVIGAACRCEHGHGMKIRKARWKTGARITLRFGVT